MKITALAKRAAFTAAAAVMLAGALCFEPMRVRADSTSDIPEPVISEYAVFGDRIVLSLDNTAEYQKTQMFDIAVSGKLIKTVSLPKDSKINIYDNGKYLKPNTNYTITVAAHDSGTASIKVKTEPFTYYIINKNVNIYRLSNGKMKKKAIAEGKSYATGEICTAEGKAVAGMSVKSVTGEFIRITSGEYKGCFIKCSDTSRSTRVNAQRQIVTAYGKSMNGGSYAWGCASYRYTDCSGLTMQCYNQIGLDITHSVYIQGQKGKRVSVNSMQPGDLLILNYNSHVAMYVGDGKMVHAMNYYDGIKVQPISYLKYYHVDSVRRLIY